MRVLGVGERIRRIHPRKLATALHDGTDGRRHELALELKLLVALSISTLICIVYICCKFIGCKEWAEVALAISTLDCVVYT
jgi:hypothetical protein